MKFLLVDDDIDLREVLSMLIGANYNIELIEASDGQAAIEKLQTEGPFDIVICDYNMPKKSGADVYVELRKQNKTTPFVLVSTDVDKFKKVFPGDPYMETVDKPFDESELIQKIENMLSQKKLLPQKEGYLPVSIEILEKIVYSGVSLFIRLNNGHCIKVLNHEAPFNKSEVRRFKNKKITHLYVELIDIKTLISNFRKNIFSKMDWNSVDTNEAIENLKTDWELILQGSKNFGWSETVTSLAKENIAKTLILIKRVPKLQAVLERLKLSGSKRQVAPHCYFLALFATAILKELAWDSASTLQKITFAALLHDMELTDEIFTDKISRISAIVFSGQKTDFSIFEHPLRAAEFVSFWTSCPPDVDKLILQHHERFDGNGFPHKLNFQTIFPLAGVMIMAEDIIYQLLVNKNLNVIEYMKSRESYYSRGDFKKIYMASLKVLEEST